MSDWADGLLSIAGPAIGSIFGGPVGGILGSAVSGLFSGAGQRQTNIANAGQAANQMSFQQSMSNTSYQRAVEDMQAAGLNPMLAYSQGGASVPGGAQAQMGNSLGQGVSSAQMGAKLAPEIDNLRATADNTRAVTGKVEAETETARSQNIVNMAQAANLAQQTRTGTSTAAQLDQVVRRLTEENDANIGHWSARGVKAKTYREAAEADIAEDRMRGGYGKHEAREMRERARAHAAGATLEELGVSKARAHAGMYDRAGGQAIPYLESLAGPASSAASVINRIRR